MSALKDCLNVTKSIILLKVTVVPNVEYKTKNFVEMVFDLTMVQLTIIGGDF